MFTGIIFAWLSGEKHPRAYINGTFSFDLKIDSEANLKGKMCPFNFVYAKQALYDLEDGEILKIIVDDPLEGYRGAKQKIKNYLFFEVHFKEGSKIEIEQFTNNSMQLNGKHVFFNPTINSSMTNMSIQYL